jgi:Cu-processing system permease protein
MELNIVSTVAGRELREALRNRWLAIFTLGFTGLAFALSRASLASAGYAGLGGFGRTAASLVNALLLFIPLLGLSIGAVAIAGDRERGSLLYLLAQPVSRGEVFLGKAMGIGLAGTLAILVGFGLAAIAFSANGSGNPGSFLALVGFALLLEWATLGLGFLISAISGKSSTAMGGALILWLGLVFLGDLGLIGTTLVLRPTPATLLGMLLANPLQVFKLGSIYSLRATLDTLGPVGQYAVYRFGPALPIVLVILLVLTAFLTFGLAYLWFSKRKEV